MSLSVVTFVVFLLNVTFGYWRANVPKHSVAWFLAIHSPIPFIVLLRIYSKIGFVFLSYPLFIGAFFLGQLIGGRLKVWLRGRGGAWVSSCLVWDMLVAICRPIGFAKKNG